MSYATRLASLNAKALLRFGAEHLLNGVAVQGDFILPGKTFTLSDGMEVQARVPTLVVADGDVPVNPVSLAAVCDAVSYTVEEALPDGFGLTVLHLQKA